MNLRISQTIQTHILGVREFEEVQSEARLEHSVIDWLDWRFQRSTELLDMVSLPS